MFSYGAWRGPEPGGVENPFLFTFSPLHWHAPGFTDGITFTFADLIASVSLAAAVGAVLVLSFAAHALTVSGRVARSGVPSFRIVLGSRRYLAPYFHSQTANYLSPSLAGGLKLAFQPGVGAACE